MPATSGRPASTTSSAKADIRRIYAGEPDALDLLKRYNVDFIVVSPMERNQLAVNDRFIDQFPVIGRSGDYTLYEVPKAAGLTGAPERRSRSRSSPPWTKPCRRRPTRLPRPWRPALPRPSTRLSPRPTIRFRIAGSGSGRSSSSSLPP
jgi:hypothetical protein